MPVIENNRLVNDPWTRIGDGDAIAGRSMIIVPFTRLDEALAVWPAGHRGLGLDLPNDVAIAAIAPHLARFDIIALNFPGFADGRAFSQARSLRATHRFAGTIRVRGKFIPDQYAMLLQSGVDSFEVSERFPLDAWACAARTMPAAYQRDYAAGASLATRPLHDAQAWPEQPHYG